MNKNFPAKLNKLRKDANLTDLELAELADVPRSLISGLQSGQRTAGELQARRIGKALGLCGTELEEFVLSALNSCSHKVMHRFRSYPAVVLNLLAQQLQAVGVSPEHIQGLQQTGGDTLGRASLLLSGGRRAVIQMQVT